MAYQKTFISLDNETFTLTIGGVTPTSAPPLGADPISTEEDGDADMFMPVRTQSGYIRMQSEDKTTWRQFIPSGATAMPVTLKKGTSIAWQGYVQTGTYGMTYPAIYEEIELPVCCGLSVLESFDMDVTGPADMVTIGQLLYNIFSKLTGLTYKFYFHVPNVSSMNAWLQYKVIWRNFLTEDGGELKAAYNCREVLEELCKFFGWSCRQHGDGIWFTCIADGERSDMIHTYTMAQLRTGNSSTFVSFSQLSLVNDDFASTDHTEEWIPGCKSVTVNSELNPFDTIIEMPSDELLKKYRTSANNVVTGTRWTDGGEQTVYILKQVANMTYENALVRITTHEDTPKSDGSLCRGRLIIFDKDIQDVKMRYNWTVSIDCLRSNTYGSRTSTTPLVTMESKAAYILSDGILYINGKTDASLEGTAVCTLRVGNTYWNGSSWTTTASTFDLYCDNQGVKDTRTDVADTEYDGTGIRINSTLTGKIYFAINDVRPTFYLVLPLDGFFPLQDFEIGFVRRQQDDEANDLNYSATGGAFPDEITVDTIFSTDKHKTDSDSTIRCEMGYGLLFSDSAVVDTIPGYRSGQSTYTSRKPEQHNADVIAAYGSQIRQVMTFDLWQSRVAASPSAIVTFESKRYFPVSVSHHWRDGIQSVKLMQI